MVKGSTTPACAACKYQRRKCSPKCPLAPYFPANQPKTFQCVHRLFGVSNVTKTLRSLKTDIEKDDAMKSIIFESKMREQFPVEGCTRVIQDLRLQIHYALQELNRVHAQLAACRNHHLWMNAQPSAAAEDDYSSTWVPAGGPPTYFESGWVDPRVSDSHPSWLPGSTRFDPGASSSNAPPPTTTMPANNYHYLMNENSGGFYSDSDLSGIKEIQEQMESFGIQQFPRLDQDSDELVMKSMEEKLSQIDRDHTY
ncbi:PREDICTED: LOB domain-containing protein 27-like [Erythranthe guttata]|uniref:LOB domain-containing protein 27-like n=1 Tax=Erythranthe guttata TaxID=4155 RepID=UPI00064E1545|nr:PREDICTED: LOB domain-containing protein 27-like [Erythranthe guttata]|eukprot:XP_012840473.1 PREDICTED: LOB domain-containing protein 27-like [Erythranthe guttata]